jgi:hypothetical protein
MTSRRICVSPVISPISGYGVHTSLKTMHTSPETLVNQQKLDLFSIAIAY